MVNNGIHWVLAFLAVSLFLVGCSQQEEPQATGTKETTQTTQKDTATQKDMNKQADMAKSQSQDQEVAAAEEQVSTDTSAANGQGQEIYRKNCASCHDTGVSGAPKLGDQTAWESHVGKGMDQLVKSVVDGKGQMPPKGGNPSLSKAEIQAAVDYMVGQVQ